MDKNRKQDFSPTVLILGRDVKRDQIQTKLSAGGSLHLIILKCNWGKEKYETLASDQINLCNYFVLSKLKCHIHLGKSNKDASNDSGS